MTSVAYLSDAPRAPSAAFCTHCTLEVPSALLVQGATVQFCCEGCRTAYAILHEHGLEGYYALPERRERAVRRSARTYDEFDHPTFHELYVTTTAAGLSRVELYLEGVHCASCVWLVERVPLLISGVSRAELDVRRSRATIEWYAADTSLSAIARTLDSLGYAPHPFRGVKREAMRRAEDRAALTRIGVAGAIAINVMLPALALYSGWWSGMEPQYERFFRWISLALVVPALLGPGRVFFTGAIAAFRTRSIHWDLPIAIALGAGFLRGAVNTVTDTGPVYFDGVTTLIFLLLCGRFLQQRGQRVASDSAEMLYSLTPGTARLVGDDLSAHDVPAESLVPGQIIEVRAGDTFPADGTVEWGESSVNRSLLTGESRPVAAGAGEMVFGGTLNVSSPLRVRVTRTGEESRIGRILAQVESSAQRRAPIVRLADRLSTWFVVVVLLLAAGVYLAWVGRDSALAIDNTIALLVVTCPCALALATPFAVTAAIGRAAGAGIFIKGGDVVETLARSGRIFLDKTGTVTEGCVTLARWEGPDWVRPLVLGLERGSTHPVAQGFREAWSDVSAIDARAAEHIAGGGIVGVVEGHLVVVGSPAFVAARLSESLGCDARAECEGITYEDACAELDGLTPVFVAIDDTLVGRAYFGDRVRADAASAIEQLRARGWRVSLLSGDDPRVVASVARELGISADDAIGGASPEDKLAIVERACRTERVVMVGDGVNDAAAIAAATVGIGVHGGAEACLASSDVYLTRPGLSALVDLTDGARRTMRVIRRNIVFSLAYNAIGVALAITGLISPLLAALLMPASSLTVIIGSWRSRTFDGGVAIDAGSLRSQPSGSGTALPWVTSSTELVSSR